MTIVSEIITDAYRLNNITPIDNTLSAAQQFEALKYLNRIVKSIFGTEFGEKLQNYRIGISNITTPVVANDLNIFTQVYVPSNSRLILNLNSATSVSLDPFAQDGARFAISDASSNLASYNLSLYGNGNTIEGATSLLLNTNGLDKEWFYRADLSNWMPLSSLLISDTFPFPEEFDDFFVTLLNIRLNPAYDIQDSSISADLFKRIRKKLKARYSQKKAAPSERGIVRMTNSGRVHEGYPTTVGDFNRGNF